MARILDKDTRLIDIDFGPLSITTVRTLNEFNADAITLQGNGQGQLLNTASASFPLCGSFIQYERIDLDFMVRNNEIVIPVDASIQRTSPVPLGYSNNGNNFDQIEEYVYVFSRPLNNANLSADLGSASPTYYELLRDMGLDRSEGDNLGSVHSRSDDISGKAGWPNQSQCIYAEKRMYSYNESLGATIGNRGLDPANPVYETIFGMPVLDSVTTWGAMEGITGPNLHAYRVVINRTQTFPALAATFKNQALGGETQLNFPPVSIRFLCKDPDYTEGQYLTRLANAMNNIAEDGPVA